ncbi:Ig-like domain-containing protein [Chryseolinea lacunae]|uniref:Ig-like domain-containing protein n=1 Tax=Chryseolinea lacunae TaxID=2801331 RepID=A0ABS1L0C3_9BACT|nr:Ig-like domain-containing protein [Chryseolinea lacunae]MBL0744962.1 Ig-like domain-containing protein [Chryseolinea lacunae]
MEIFLRRKSLLLILMLAVSTLQAWANNTVTVEKAGSQADPVNTGPILFVVTFNEAVTGFTNTDVDLSTSTTSGTLAAVVTEIAPNNGTTYQVSVSGMTGTGNVTARLNAGAATLVSNGTTTTAASTSSDNTVRYDITPPTVSSLTPADNATGVAVNTNLVINFSSNINKGTGTIELRRDSDDSIVESYVLPGAAEVTVSGMDATINPSANLVPNTKYYVIVPATAFHDNATNDFAGLATKGNWDFTTVNPPPDIVTLDPANGATGVPVATNSVKITFTEPVVNVGDNSNNNNRIIIRNMTASATHETIDPTAAGRVTIAGNDATITLSVALVAGTKYSVRIGNSVFDDVDGGSFAGTGDPEWQFTLLAAPVITSIESGASDPTSATCIGEDVTIHGTDFGASPTVTINGVTIPYQAGNTNTQIVFTVPGTVSGTYPIVVKNNTTNLSGSSANITFKPAINLALGVSANPSSAAVGGMSNINVANSQSTVTYQMILGASTNIGNTQTGNGSQLSFATDASPNGFTFPTPGPTSYTYKFKATSAGCTDKFLTGTATVSVSAVTADAGPDKLLCIGDAVTIGGSPTASGGTGFLNVSWSGPSSFTSNAPNPSVTTPGIYTVTVKDNTGATDTDDVEVNGSVKPSITFVDTLRRQFSYDENKYQLSNKVVVTPNDGSGVFTGQGVSYNSDNKYYFNPQAFTTYSTGVPITYTHTTLDGCSDAATFFVDVYQPGTAINNLKSLYCSTEGQSNILSFNGAIFTLPPGKSFSSFKIYQGYDPILGVYLTYDPADPNYPLTQLPGFPRTYRLNPTKAYNLVGPTTMFILIYLRTTATGIEDPTWYTYGATRLVAPGAVPEILPLAEGQLICEKDPLVTLSNSLESPIFGYTSLGYEEPDDNSVVGSGPYRFNPDLVNFAPSDVTKDVTLFYNYKDINGCVGQAERIVTVVKKAGGPTAPDQQYCQFFEGQRVLVASAATKGGFTWYENSNLSDLNPVTGSVLDTQISTQNPITKSYYVTHSALGCESNPTTAVISVTPAPVINLTIPAQCEGIPFTYVGPTPPGNNPSYEWKFEGDNQVYTTKDVDHTFPNAGAYSLRLLVRSETNSQQCETSATVPILVGAIPKANFTFNQLCDGDNTQFHGTANLTIDKMYWDFGDGDVLVKDDKNASAVAHAGRTGGVYKDPSHKFVGGPIDYTVELRVFTNLNCSDTVKSTVRLLPYLTYNSQSPYQMENENGGDGFWSVDSSSVNSSWNFLAPNDTVIHNTANAWVTNGNKFVNEGNYKSSEQSAVNSPCFDLTGFSRPVLSMDYIASTAATDGAVLQLSTDGGLNWDVLGSKNSGLNWYNTLALNGANPGGQFLFAWSGGLFDVNLAQSDTLWLQARHSLDVAKLPANKRNKVRFRVAFASNSDPKRSVEGFAFNNVHIEDRNRIMLVENFTNVQAAGAAVNNDRFNDLLENEIVKIQYNVSFPGEDPINLENPTDPNARGAYYGITNVNQIVPRVYLDGNSQGKLTAPDDWLESAQSLRSLVTSAMAITVNTVPAKSNELSVKATLTPTQPITQGKLAAHVAIVETPVGNNQYVLRKMLPSPSGLLLTLPLAVGVPVDLPVLTWKADNQAVNPANLAVVVFVQDEDTQEVLQAAVLKNPANLPTEIITGTESSFSQQTALYPNPADHRFVIRLPEVAKKDIPMSVFDTFGREVQQRTLGKGQQQMTVDTQNLTEGVYLVQFEALPGVVVRKKVMVVHP